MSLRIFTRALLFALVCGQGNVLAENYEVTTALDTVDKDLSDNLCADISGLCSLRAAIQNANKLPASDTITLGQDTYNINIAGNDHSTETGDDNGDLDITYDLILNGEGVDKSIISVSNALQERALHILTGAVVTISGVTIKNGSATQSKQSGGGILIEQSATLEISNCSMLNNISNFSGGGISNLGNLNVVNCQFSNNQAPGYFGGGIFIGVSANQASINNSTFNNNSSGFGGAIHHGSKSNASIISSVFYDNNGTSGTGGISTGWTDAVLSIINSTVSGNTSGNNAAVSTMSSNSTLHILNSTVANNVSKINAGGIANYGVTRIRNSIVTDNISIANGNQDCSGPIISEGNNLIGINANCNFSASASDIVGASGNPANARLAPLANNGGTTLTHALLAGSQAIDAGNPAQPGSGGFACEMFDQRGVDRAATGRICDIGAYEISAGADIWVSFAAESKMLANSLQQQTIYMGNNGVENARNVRLIIALDEGSQFQGINAEDWVCSQSSGNSFACVLGLLAKAKEYELTIQTLPPAGVASYTTKALIVSDTPDPLADNNQAETTVLVNNAPKVYTESTIRLDKPYGVIASKAVITDTENDDLTQASVRINSGYNPDVDTLVLADSSAIAVQWDATTGTLELQGNDTLSNYQNALRQIAYNNSDSDNYTGSRVITITVSDSLQSSLPAVLSLSLVSPSSENDDDSSGGSDKDPFADDKSINNDNTNNINQDSNDTRSSADASISDADTYDILMLYIIKNESHSDEVVSDAILNGKLLTSTQRDSAWISVDSILSSSLTNSFTTVSAGAVFFAGVVGLFGRLGSLITLLFSSPLLIQFDPVPVVLISKNERRRREKEFDRIRSLENINKGVKNLFDNPDR